MNRRELLATIPTGLASKFATREGPEFTIEVPEGSIITAARLGGKTYAIGIRLEDFPKERLPDALHHMVLVAVDTVSLHKGKQ